jgi:hypothetical protein
MRFSALIKVTVLSVVVGAIWTVPAAAMERTWADVREGHERDATVQNPLFTAAREAPATYNSVAPTSFAATREFSPSIDGSQSGTFASVRESAPATQHLGFDSLAYVREAPAATQPGSANLRTADRERYDPAPAVASAAILKSSSDSSDEIIIGGALLAAFFLGAGLGLVLAHRRVPSVA